MRKYFYIAILLFGFTSCDDGEIIINNFDFGEANIESCGKVGKPKVFFKINTEDVFESISLVINNAEVSSLARIITANTENEIRFILNNDNKINYRVYDGDVSRDYFCNTLPPSTPKVTQEFVSVGGTVVIATEEKFPDEEDRDGDGINDIDERDGDTDGDGILDIFDVDDDGDNVLTKAEIATANNDPETTDGYRDTDGDGIPNYLDPDDDGDGVATREEVLEANQAPSSAASPNGLPFYLDKNVSNRFEGVTFFEPNEIDVFYSSLITIERLKLQNQDGSAEEIAFDVYTFGTFISEDTTREIEPTPAPEEN